MGCGVGTRVVAKVTNSWPCLCGAMVGRGVGAVVGVSVRTGIRVGVAVGARDQPHPYNGMERGAGVGVRAIALWHGCVAHHR